MNFMQKFVFISLMLLETAVLALCLSVAVKPMLQQGNIAVFIIAAVSFYLYINAAISVLSLKSDG